MQPTNATYRECSLSFEKWPMCVRRTREWRVIFFIFFWSNWGGANHQTRPRNWFPTQIAYSAYNIVHIKQTRSQGHFSIGPQRGRGSSKLYIIFLLNGMMNKDELSGINTPHSNIHTDRHVCTTIHLHTHTMQFLQTAVHT